ncbi:MAG: DNA polymerase III subunit alpha [Parvularcula sp.]
MSTPFVHLHVHSSFSLAEGAIPIKRLSAMCREDRMPAVAIADTNNLFGALEASETLSADGIQPITAIEVRVRLGESPVRTADGRLASVVLLAQNRAGYERMMALTSAAFVDQPDDGEIAVAWEDILDANEGIICLTGGPDGPIDLLLTDGREEEAKAALSALSHGFANRLYVEIQRHPSLGITSDEGRYPTEARLLRLAFDGGLPIVAANTAYFPARADHAAHDALLCIAGGRYISETDRRQATEDNYFKSQQEMRDLFPDLPEAIDATAEIAQRCAYRPRTHDPILPSFAGDIEAEKAALREQASKGLKRRLASIETVAPEEDYWARLEMELDIIERMGFPGYFLIVSDFIKWAKANNIPVGPGRGSGAGSLVAYALTVTDLDPLRFNLLFERFLNPERVSMPDFDVDFCQDRRDEVIAYVQERYGHDRVAQIITFGKLQARAVLRDVGRVLQMPFGQVDRLCKLVPNNPANPVTLAEAIKGEPKFKEERDRDEMVGVLIDTALRLEGLYRHASTHAAGVVIGDRPLQELVPLYRDPRSPMPATQFNMKWVEPAGLVKFDFLGLKTLTVIRRALDYLQADGIVLDIDTISTSDAATYEMLGKGDAIGVFQLESAGMRATLKGMNADCLEDIIALVSLYRPGPMDNIPTYIERKAGREEPDYLHPLLEDVLRETYGVIIYQEQVMQIAQILSGYSLGEADLLRRAMGKKKKEEMDKQKIRFVDGARERDVDPAKAESIFELVAKFAGYGFNKSHAAAYAWISYQTAFLKANHTPAFLAASMSLDAALTDKLAVFASEARRCGVDVLGPCVNHSQADFSVDKGAIRYALGAIKNVSGEAMAFIVARREEGGPFADIYDFCERVELKKVGRRSVEQLARAGAFDAIHANRAQIATHADFLIRYSAAVHEEKSSAQGGLFGDVGDSQLSRPTLPETPAISGFQKLDQERQALGFYLSGHPLDDFHDLLTERGVVFAEQVTGDGWDGPPQITMAGVVRDTNRRRSKKGKLYAWLELSDPTGEFEVTVFSDLLNASEALLVAGTRLMLTVRCEEWDGALRLTAESIRALDKVATGHDNGGGFRVIVEGREAVGALKRTLMGVNRAADDGPLTPIILVVPVPEVGCDVEILVEAPVSKGPETRSVLKSVAGVADVSFAERPVVRAIS